jgi:hypothetical protein
MIDRHERSAGRPQTPRRPLFVGDVPPFQPALSCWEIRRESPAEDARFAVYLEGARIGRERGPAELTQLLTGARLRREDVRRVVEALVESPVVWVEVRPEENSVRRRS